MTILLRALIYFSLSLVKCTVLHIYGSTNSGEVLANFSNSQLSNYSLLPSHNLKGKFLNLDSRHGLLRSAYSPDCETTARSPLKFFVQAFNKTSNTLRTLDFVVIYIHKGACSVKFQRNLDGFAVVSRSAKVGTRVFSLKDLFSHRFTVDSRYLRLANEAGWQHFSIDSITGHLLLRKSLIGKQQSLFNIIVEFPVKRTANNRQSRLKINSANLKVYVDDKRTSRRVKRRVRNNPPQFASSYAEANVREDCPIGTTVTTIKATDVDSGSNGILRYSMSATQNLLSKSFFSLNAITGVITTAQKLDREKMDRHYFQVTARDQGDPSLESYMDLTIIVDDINDNQPIFESSSYAKSIPENTDVGDPVLEVRARDDDDGKNSKITYSFQNGAGPKSAFAIDSRTGVITVQNELDREKVDFYNLKVKAEDQGTPPKSATVDVKITITDINDCVPQFSKKVYKETIKEDTRVGKLVATIAATDCDKGSNGEVFYEIVTGNDLNLFSINKINGEVRVQGKLDFEGIPWFSLWINAQDKGTPFLVNQTVLEIELLDVNDNAPIFITPHFHGTVQENTGKGKFVTRVMAYDRDDKLNRQLTYSLLRNDVPFAVNPSSGDITTNGKLDREKTAKYTFGVKAVDSGSPPKEGTAQITITVADVNDNPPKFQQSTYRVSLSEQAKFGATVLQVTAKDPDSNPTNIMYSIDPFPQQRCFRINSQGLITLSCMLNYKMTKFYTFEIRASDGLLDSTAVVYVNISDSNNNAPVFEKRSYKGRVWENAQVGTSVLKVKAKDDDTGINAKISYSFSRPASEFSIDSDSGIIRTAAKLDKETKGSYTLTVTATDHGKPPLKKNTFVFIRVKDVNDNAPEFKQKSYSATVREDVRPGYLVTTVSAKDKDTGKNKQIVYSFAPNGDGNGAFEIDSRSDTGIIRTRKKLDRETKASYKLIVIARDRGTPPQQSSVTVTVDLEDVIDSRPIFLNSDYQARIKEDVNPGTTVLTVKAKAQDKTPDTGIRYSIDSRGNSGRAFRINQNDGTITTAVDLDFETQSEYTLTVRATLRNLFSSVKVRIYLDDVNDNRPVLENFYMSINVKQDLVPPEARYKIPAYDPDISDKLTFSIVEGNQKEWVTLNSSGYLSVSPTLVNARKPAEILIKVSDGEKSARAKGSIMVTSITTEMLSNSFEIEIDDMTVKEFLNLAYDKLARSIASRLGLTMDQVLLFDIKSRIIKSTKITEYDKTQLIIWLVVRKKDDKGRYYGFFGSDYVRNIISIHRKEISKDAGVNLLPIPNDLCNRKPCNSAPSMRRDCMTFTRFIGNPTVLSSPKVVFRTVPVEMLYNCTCPVDFREPKDCDTHLNLCFSNPCKNNGKCVSVEKGFVCLCLKGRMGRYCESNSTNSCPPSGKEKPRPNQLTSNPCYNDGYCLDDGVGGFKCGCKDKPIVDTPFCQLSTRSFKDGDFAAFPALKKKWSFHIKLEFATIQSDGVLLYNGRHNNKEDFVAIEIVKGQVQFTVSTDHDVAIARTDMIGGVNDGTWHTVTAIYKNQTGVVILDECDLGVAVQLGNQQGSYSCAAAKRLTIKRADRAMELTGPLLLGGLPSSQSTEFPINNVHYTGCIRNIHIDYQLLDLAKPEFIQGTKPKCEAKQDFCRDSPCDKGNCTNSWGTYYCACPKGYGGKKCETEIKTEIRLTGKSILVKAFRTPAISLPWRQTLQLRTRKPRGYLMETRFRSDSGVLKIVDGRISYLYGKAINITLKELRVDDGAWHHVEITWEKDKVKITADYVFVASQDYSGVQLEFTSEIIVGAKRDKSGSKMVTSNGFTGCIAGITANALELDLKGASKTEIYDGCKMPTHCQSSPCYGGSTCVEDWDSYKCICKPGHVGKRCKDVCRLKPCQHGSCVKTSSSSKGFKCLCPKKYAGEYCETKKELPCSDKFFSASNIGQCGPCNCPLGGNFNPVCNKTTGECYCNRFHYRRYEGFGLSKECYKCDCESIGSTSPQCSVVGGQCPCTKGSAAGAEVVGRRCDQCEGRQSEIMKTKGCVVINTSCPRSMAEDIWWKRGAFNKMAKQKCPFGASGVATRFCDQEKGWQKPNLMDCVSNSFLTLRTTLKKLEKGDLTWTPEIAMKMSRRLDLALTLATRLYPNDIEIALGTITVLFNYESKQNSSTLISAKNHQFAQILFESASMLFNADNKEVWSVVQRNSAGTADLMLKMENFSGTLANNLAHLKRGRYKRSTDSIIPPYTIITPNILMNLDPLMMKNFEGTMFPPSQTAFAAYSDDWSTVTTKVVIPKDIFKSEGHRVLEKNAAVGYMVIRNIGDLLPKSFDAQMRESKYKVEVNSDVVSVRMPGMENIKLKDPIQITFYNRYVNRSEYICVFWNYSVPNTRGGGWSTNGCRRVAVNWTHTTCACTHMTSFAVLSDLNLEYLPKVSFAMRIVTYVGIAVCIFILLIAFISFMCLRGLKKSNATDIHKNLIAAIVLAEAVFLAGINRTEDETACRLIAILLHYFFSTVFTWMLVEAVHMYRRLSEKRNVDTGRMNFYYFLGWGCPAVVVGISAGLTTDGYGSKHFCWMSTDGTLIWTFTIPVMIVVAINTVVFLMAVYMSLNKNKKKRKRRHSYSPHGHDENSLKAGLRASAILLPLLGVTLVFAILMVNKDLEMFHYSFAALTCFQGLFIFLFYCLFDKKVRKEFKNAYVRWKTGDKTYGIPKPVQHFKRSYHPGEMTAVRSPYHYDEDDGGNTSTSEPSSSMPSSTAGTSRPTSTAYSTGMSIPDSSVRSAGDGLTGSEVELDEILPKAKAKYYPDNPELEKARKMWETPEKGEHSTTNPESSSDDENRNPSPVILSDTSESSGDEQIPNGEEKTPDKSRKNHKAAPFYASDGPMHSTPIDTTPEEEPDMKKKAFDDSDSSDTEEEDKALERPLKEHPKFTSTPEIIPDVVASGSAATTSDTTPDTPILALKKPLKSALKKPRSSHTEEPSPASPLLLDNNDEPYEAAADKSPESSVADSQSRSKSRKEKKRRKHRPSRDRKPFVKFGNRGSLMSEPSEFI